MPHIFFLLVVLSLLHYLIPIFVPLILGFVIQENDFVLPFSYLTFLIYYNGFTAVSYSSPLILVI